MALGRPDPHRLGRLPGLLAPRHADRLRRRRRHVPLRLRRQPGALHARARRAHPGRPRLRHRDVPRHLPARRASPRAELEDAVRRTTLWAQRQRDLPRAPGQLRFAITQGGLDTELRRRSSEELVPLDFDGYAIGGLSVGEARGADVRGDRARRVVPASREAALLHGHRRPRGRDRGDRARRRHVRLRAADPHGAHRHRAHLGGPPQPPERPLRPRPAPARRVLRLPRLHDVQPRLHPPSREPGGDPRPSPPEPA